MKSIIFNDKIIRRPDISNPEDIRSIIIEEDVEEIADNAFAEFHNLQSITISKNNKLRVIGKSAFKNCNNLVWLNLGICNKLEIIDDEAFYGCSSIKILRLYNSVKKIGNEAFSSSSIVNFHLSSTLEEIGARAFSNCQALSYIVIPKQTQVAEDAFFDTRTEVIQINKNSFNNEPLNIDKETPPSNKEYVIIITPDGRVFAEPVRDDYFFISGHEFCIEYIVGKYLDMFVDKTPNEWILENSLSVIYFLEFEPDIVISLGLPNDMSETQILTTKKLLEHYRNNFFIGIQELIDGSFTNYVEQSSIGEFLDDFDNIVSNNCHVKYYANKKPTSTGARK